MIYSFCFLGVALLLCIPGRGRRMMPCASRWRRYRSDLVQRDDLNVCHSTFSKLAVIPNKTVVLAGDSTFLNCSGLGYSSLTWCHYPLDGYRTFIYINEHISTEGISLGFRSGGKQDLGERNLVIANATLNLSGKYECTDVGDKDKDSAELIVLKDRPKCHINMEEFVGPNDCNVPQNDISLSCNVNYRGNKAPELEWRRDSEVIKSTCTTENKTVKICNRTVKPDLDLNGTSFVCQTTERSAKDQYYCTTNSITILYAFSSEESTLTGIYVGDEVVCIANSSQSCTYKWVWYERVGSDFSRTIESTSNVLIAKKTGKHRCEAQCNLQNQPCEIFPKFIDVIESENDPKQFKLSELGKQENAHWISADKKWLIAIGVSLCAAFGCYVFKRRLNKFCERNRDRKQDNDSQLEQQSTSD